MKFIADLHIHSRHSRATSRDMSPESIWKWAQLKGITVIGTGDFTHPAWLKELSDKLESAGNGLFSLKSEFRQQDIPDSCKGDVFFMLSAEISCIYRKNGKTRKIHALVYVPDLATATRLNKALSKIGNLAADGRPILGLDAKELLKIVLDASSEALLVPAHAWTPHFSVFGAESGFDSLEECFEELTPNICAIETGLSSDPLMNWQLSALDRITLISNSDAHSPAKIGREANIFNVAPSYGTIIDSLRKREGFSGTIEFFPEEGKYHYDGHRACGICLTPDETVKQNFLCPVCGKKVTVGVMHRVARLANRRAGFRPEKAMPFHSIIPLQEIIAEVLKAGPNTKKVSEIYMKLLQRLGNEFSLLMDIPLSEIAEGGSPLISEAIGRMRGGKIHISPGFDGEFGKINIFGQPQKKEIERLSEIT